MAKSEATSNLLTPLAHKTSLKKKPKKMHVDSFFHEETISMSVEEVKSQEYQLEKECPLKRWTGPVS